MKVKKWDGYSSWNFLEPKVDFQPYATEKQTNRVPEYDFGLSKTQEERFEEFIEKNIIISLHDHLDVFPLEGSRAQARVYTAYEGLAHSGLDAVFGGGAKYIGPTDEDVVNYLGMSLCDYAHQNLLVPAFNVNDVTRAYKDDKIAVIMSIEKLSSIGHNIDKIDLYFGLGLRQAGLVSVQTNPIGSELSDVRDGGLTDFGYNVVKRMNKIGMIIDLSHAHDITSLEAIEASNKPVTITHCGSRTLTYNMRMKPDDVLQAMAEKGGVIGVEAAGFAPRTDAHPEATIECTLDHIKYLMDLLGKDHVGVGLDAFWGDHAGLYKKYCDYPKKPSDYRPRPPDLPPILDRCKMRAKTPVEFPHVQGLENPGEMINIAKGLIRDGYSDTEIAKIMGLNGLRVIKNNWPY